MNFQSSTFSRRLLIAGNDANTITTAKISSTTQIGR